MSNISKAMIISVVFIVGAVLYIYRTDLLVMFGVKPEIVEEYVCSDVCSEKDIKKIYKGVTDDTFCRRIGGTPYTYYGWGKFTACLAE